MRETRTSGSVGASRAVDGGPPDKSASCLSAPEWLPIHPPRAPSLCEGGDPSEDTAGRRVSGRSELAARDRVKVLCTTQSVDSPHRVARGVGGERAATAHPVA